MALFGLNENRFGEYGLDGLNRETALKLIEAEMKRCSDHCLADYEARTGESVMDEEFFVFVELAAAWDRQAYFLKQVRRELNDAGGALDRLSDLAVAQLAAIRVILETVKHEHDPMPLSPSSRRAHSVLDYYCNMARDIMREAERVRAYREADATQRAARACI